MKLIDFLVSKGRSGWCWPNGMVKATCNIGSSAVNFYLDYSCPPTLSEMVIATHNFDEPSCISREQYEAALAASKPEWDGKGLPPLGCECEWQDKNTKAWLPVVIAYSSEWVTVVRELRPLKVGDAAECCINNFGEEERLHFRPIRSEADKKRDEVTQSILDILNDHDFELVHIRSNQKRIAIDLVERITSGMVPHIRID